MKIAAFICAGLLAAAAGPASAGADGRLGAVHAFTTVTEAKIQAQVLDRMLGPGKAFVFLDATAWFRGAISEELKDGIGETRRKVPQGAGDPAEDLDGEQASQEQRASQQKRSVTANDSFSLAASSMTLRILHDAALPQKKLAAVRAALLALYPGRLQDSDIVFVPAAFEPAVK